jgi:hypothetical protein
MTIGDPGSVERALWALRAYDTIALATTSTAGPHVAGVFFVPEERPSGIQLVIAILAGSRTHRYIVDEPRVAFMCSPGNPTRWIQGIGTAAVVDAETSYADLFQRLLDHAPGAAAFVDRPGAQPAVITVETLKVVQAIDQPPLLLSLG